MDLRFSEQEMQCVKQNGVDWWSGTIDYLFFRIESIDDAAIESLSTY